MNAKPFPFFFSLFLMACLTSFTALADAPANDETTSVSTAELEIQINALTERLETLKEAKKHAVTKDEKQLIKHEIRDVKKEAKALKQQASGGIYIGSGVLIVALLLILLL
uniref:Seryl-tRNA synthetase n=1 Tax=Roseihalotalea indica TaxID=2867963 RepID=A0AA49GT19_9BACT|nr:hypothetical protein K4G66_12890 [Tunicatimonas sp. TK19036]